MKKFIIAIITLASFISCGKDEKEKNLFSIWHDSEGHILNLTGGSFNKPIPMIARNESIRCNVTFTLTGDQSSGSFVIDFQTCGFLSEYGLYAKAKYKEELTICRFIREGTPCTTYH